MLHEFEPTLAEKILGRALSLLELGDCASLDELAAPIYVTDAEGVITYFNPACIDMAGRKPTLGEDRWCVTWKLYTGDGASLPHEECPMAVAIRSRQPVRGVSAVAERPDGTRIGFAPFPTPLFDERGEFIGAVNLLMDERSAQRVRFLHAQADKCRRLALQIRDDHSKESLTRLADDYERQIAWPVSGEVEQQTG